MREFSKSQNSIESSVIRDVLKLSVNSDLISFAGGNPAEEAFPVEAIKKISADLLDKDPISVLQYGITEGDPEFIKAANNFFNRHEPITKESDSLLVTSGSQQIMDLMCKVFCDEGDLVVTEDPSFLGGMNCFRGNGAKVIGVPFTKEGQLDLIKLEEALKLMPKFMYLIPNYQNPTGRTMSLAVRKQVLALAKQYNVLILEDDPYGELRFKGDPIPSIKSMDEEGYCIYAGSLSKIIAPGMRIACCIGEKRIISKLTVAKQVTDVHSNLWAQKVMAVFLSNYDSDTHLSHLRSVYGHKCALMLNEMDKCFADCVSYTRPMGGMFIWVTLPDSVDVPAFVKTALSRGVAVIPGTAFACDPNTGMHSIRLNFSSPTDEEIKRGINILGQMTYEI